MTTTYVSIGWIEISFTTLFSWNLSRTLWPNTLIQFGIGSVSNIESYQIHHHIIEGSKNYLYYGYLVGSELAS
jgi:hypothetical protein